MNKNKQKLARQLLDEIIDNLRALRALIFENDIDENSIQSEIKNISTISNLISNCDGEIIHGFFNGEHMSSETDNKTFNIPANYASKSKLVFGDKLKLTILPDGSFIYKQIGPVERIALIGDVINNDNGLGIRANGKIFNVLKASLTFFKVKEGDRVTVLTPKNDETDWATIDNIIPV